MIPTRESRLTNENHTVQSAGDLCSSISAGGGPSEGSGKRLGRARLGAGYSLTVRAGAEQQRFAVVQSRHQGRDVIDLLFAAGRLGALPWSAERRLAAPPRIRDIEQKFVV